MRALLKPLFIIGIVCFAFLNAGEMTAESETAEKLVACLGDSNTQRGYSKIVAAELGAGWGHLNCGKGGATMINGTRTPYLKTKAYQRFEESDPDYVVIMLGTNDANPDFWRGERDSGFDGTPAEEFESLYKELIAEAQAKASKPQVILLTLLPIFPEKSRDELIESRMVSKQILAEEINPLIERIAEDTELPLIKVHEIMAEDEELCSDGVHYKRPGYAKLAGLVTDKIRELESEE